MTYDRIRKKERTNPVFQKTTIWYVIIIILLENNVFFLLQMLRAMHIACFWSQYSMLFKNKIHFVEWIFLLHYYVSQHWQSNVISHIMHAYTVHGKMSTIWDGIENTGYHKSKVMWSQHLWMLFYFTVKYSSTFVMITICACIYSLIYAVWVNN